MPENSLPKPQESAEDRTQEVDVWMGAYAGRALWPSFLVCAVLTGGIAVLGWYLQDRYELEASRARYFCYSLAAPVWFVQLLRWAYRMVSFNYRLTTRRLLRDRGFAHPADGEIELSRITGVTVEANFAERLVGVGRVCVLTDDEAVPPLVLRGVYQPERLAAMILGCAKQARDSAIK